MVAEREEVQDTSTAAENNGNNSEQPVPEATTSSDRSSGVYVPYDSALLEAGAGEQVVLFFHASWCPTCRALDQDINANLDAIPSEVTILKVEYDDAVALRQQYGVTTQHTFVSINQNGDELKQWSGSPRLADLLAQLEAQ